VRQLNYHVEYHSSLALQDRSLSNSKTQQWPQSSQVGLGLLKQSREKEFLDGLLQRSKDTLNSRHDALQVHPLHLEGLHQPSIRCLGVPLCDARQCLNSGNLFLDLWLKPFAFGIIGPDEAAHVTRTIPKLKLKLSLHSSIASGVHGTKMLLDGPG
jgi:hypothetical protein